MVINHHSISSRGRGFDFTREIDLKRTKKCIQLIIYSLLMSDLIPAASATAAAAGYKGSALHLSIKLWVVIAC